MKQVGYNEAFVSGIEQILKTERIESLTDLAFSKEAEVSLLYPTDDFFLTEEQFSAIVTLLSEGERLYVMQLGESDDLSAMNRVVYEFCAPFSYEEYRTLDFYSMSILFSSRNHWVMVIDESLRGGIGVLAGDSEIVRLFEAHYGETKRDICALAMFFAEDAARNENALSYMKSLLGMMKGE